MGICAGLHFAAGIGIINIKLKIVRAAGYYDIRLLKKHPLTMGYTPVSEAKPKGNFGKYEIPYSPVGRLEVRRGNGGFIKCGQGVDMIASFDNNDEWGAIVAGRRGRGKVVLMSVHPESSAGSRLSDPDPLRLFYNAVGYISATNIEQPFIESKSWRFTQYLSSFEDRIRSALVEYSIAARKR